LRLARRDAWELFNVNTPANLAVARKRWQTLEHESRG